jgi:hypothetical protein
MPRAAELELAPLTREASEAHAASCSNDALDAVAKKRWARLGGGVPLGIVEAVAWGLASGEISWPAGAAEGDKAHPRTRASGRGPVRTAAAYLKVRASDESDAARTLLCLVALRGGVFDELREGRVGLGSVPLQVVRKRDESEPFDARRTPTAR